MKTFKWLMHSLIVVFLFGCTLPTEGTPAGGGNPSISLPSPSATKPALQASNTPKSAPRASDTPKPIPQASDTPAPVTPKSGTPKGGNEPVSLNIPSQNDPVPYGILDQISWGGKGGGPGEQASQKCGNCDVEINGNRIVFSNFQPGQELHALIYREVKKISGCPFSGANYVTTLTIRVNETGDLSAVLNGTTEGLIVVVVSDARTGNELWMNYLKAYSQDCPNFCPGSPTQRLKVNQMAYVCTSGESVKLREGPGKSFPTIKSLVPGADLTVIGGPECADNWSWWRVRTESGYTGWMAEGGDNTDPYFLCPKP